MNCLVCKYPLEVSSLKKREQKASGWIVTSYTCTNCGSQQRIEQIQLTDPTVKGFPINEVKSTEKLT